MAKQTPQAALLREVGIKTKNANFDSTCKVCNRAISSTSPKCSVAAVKIPRESRNQSWIHTSCVDVMYHQTPDTFNAIAEAMSPSQHKQFIGQKDDEVPPTPKETKEMPPKKKPAPKPDVKFDIGFDETDADPAGLALANMVAPHILGQFTALVDSTLEEKVNALALPRTTIVKTLGDFDEVKVGLVHPCFDEALNLGRIRINCMATGPAGSGSHAGPFRDGG